MNLLAYGFNFDVLHEIEMSSRLCCVLLLSEVHDVVLDVLLHSFPDLSSLGSALPDLLNEVTF